MYAWTVSAPAKIDLPTSVMCVTHMLELVVSDVECPVSMLLGFLYKNFYVE